MLETGEDTVVTSDGGARYGDEDTSTADAVLTPSARRHGLKRAQSEDSGHHYTVDGQLQDLMGEAA